MTAQIYAALLWTPATDDSGGETRRDDLRTLEDRESGAHVHGLLVFRIHGRRVPSMGYFGPDDVCLGTWLPELLAARSALAVADGVHVFDEGEQGQPAFRFERRGEDLLLTLAPSLLTGSDGNAEWQDVRCNHAAFAAEVIQFAKRFRRDLRNAAPAACDAWWTEHVRDGSAIDDGKPTKPVLEIDGARFSDLASFYVEVTEQLIPGAPWGANLDAFNDILRGGFGTPEGGFVLRWKNAELSRRCLGHQATARVWDAQATRCHPSSVDSLRERAAAARRGEGPTLFDDLVEIIRVHAAGGAEAEDGVELVFA